MELLRIWGAAGFYLELYYNGFAWGRVRLAYSLFDQSELMFSGDDFYPSPLHAFDGDHTIAALVGFLTLQPGATDREHFLTYTDRQLLWLACRAEDLLRAARRTLAPDAAATL